MITKLKKGNGLKLGIIIPTYGRTSELVNQTLLSIFTCADSNIVSEVIIVDQNSHKLELSLNSRQITHLIQNDPSLTKARNFGVEKSNCDIIIFFDDDVIVHEGTFTAYLEAFKNNNSIDFIGGREILPKEFKSNQNVSSSIKSIIRRVFLKHNTNVVAEITKNGFFFCDFSRDNSELVEIDTVRGCNFAVKKEKFLEVKGFDPDFQGSAYREESDFILRLRKNGGKGVFNSKASVLHLRQLGGCNNLDKSMGSLRSKLDNELLFQKKHFSRTWKVIFFLRLLPLGLEHFKDTKGRSLMMVLKYVLNF